MTDALRKYLSRLTNTRTLTDSAIEDYQDEMASKVIPKNLRGSIEKRRIATEARARVGQKAAKRRDKED